MSRVQCCEWFKCFEHSRMLVGGDTKPGRPSTSTDDDHIERARTVICGNHCLTVREVSDEVGISVGSCHEIFSDKLKMRRVRAKFMPHLLTDGQKQTGVEMSQELLAAANGNFLKNIMTGDETWL